MKTALRVALATALAAGGLAVGGAASAAPMIDPGVATANARADGVEKARIVCDAWGRCWRTRPRYYGPYYGPPRWGYGWGGPRHFYGGGWGHRRHWGPGW